VTVCASGTPRTEATIRGGILPITAQAKQAPSETPASEITLRYDPPTLIGITAWVGITNNANNPAVSCTYSDGVNPARPFTVTGSEETPIPIAGIPTGTVYNITVSCDNGRLTHSEQKQF
jgi:hypothetical protein